MYYRPQLHPLRQGLRSSGDGADSYYICSFQWKWLDDLKKTKAGHYPRWALWHVCGSTLAQRLRGTARVSLHSRINLSPFTKDFRGGEHLRVFDIFGCSALSRAARICSKTENVLKLWINWTKRLAKCFTACKCWRSLLVRTVKMQHKARPNVHKKTTFTKPLQTFYWK